MSKVRACFLGTPDFAVTSLQRLLEDDHYEIVGVVTQPDRPAGRKMQLTPSPVKTLALEKGLRVISPDSVNKEEVLNEISSWTAEVAIVVAFGQILSQKFLDLFPRGAVNVHGSILPKWRGAAPIQRSIEAGDDETGVTLQKIVKALDAGDLLGARRLKIGPEMNAQELYSELAVMGADLLHLELMDYLRGNLAPIPQDPGLATFAKKIEKSEGEIDWSQSAQKIHNKVRAFVMGPGTWTTFQGKKIKIHQTRYCPVEEKFPAGTISEIGHEQISVSTGAGLLEILELQPESRSRMKASEFLLGNALKVGDKFG